MSIIRIRTSREYALTDLQLEILYTLKRDESMNVYEIIERARKVSLDPMTVRSALLSLLRKGLVKKGRYRWKLTPEGVEVVKEARFWGIR